MLTLKSILTELSVEQINQVVASGIRAGRHGNSGTNDSTESTMSTESDDTSGNTGTNTNTN